MKVNSHRRNTIAAALALCMSCMFSISASAAEKYPSKPVTIIVPFPAGGGTDLAIRSLQARLQKEIGATLIIENRSGAGGTIGTSAAAKAAADGYTLVAVTTTTTASAKAVYPNITYDALKDFTPVGMIGLTPFVLAVSSSMPVGTFKEFLPYAKSQGAKLNFASVGNGSASHLVGELFKQKTGISMTHVPYKGAAPAQTDLVAGHVQVLFDNPTALVQYVRAGKIKALAISTPSTALPELKTFEALGLADFRPALWYGLMAPADTPQEIVNQLQGALAKVLAEATVQAELQERGIAPFPMKPNMFAERIAQDTAFWSRIAQSVKAGVD